MHTHKITTQIFVAVFILLYITHLILKIRKNGLDLYDFLFLLAIAIIPGVFVFMPEMVLELSQALGVEFPFVIMFALLILILFVQIHRMLIEAHRDQSRIIHLAQRLAYLEHKMEESKSRSEPNDSRR